MRKFELSVLLLISITCFSQNKQILYNFNSIPQSLMLNPGSDVKYNWYAGIPLLSGFSANIGSSGFSIYDLFAKNGVDFSTKLRNVVFSSSKHDLVTLNEQLEIFNGGFKLGDKIEGNNYVSFGMYQEANFLTYMPKDYAILAINGNKDYLGKAFDLGDLSFKAELLSVFHLGYHKKIDEKLVVGARMKIYSSIFNVSSTRNSGYFYTTQASTNTIYNQVLAPNLLINTSGISNNAGLSGSDIMKKTLLGGNLGLGLDLGLTYYPKENLQFTASIADIGFINHTKETESYSYKGNYKYIGLTPDFNPNENTDITDEFKKAIPFDTIKAKFTTWRPIKLNTSVQYSFGDGRGTSSCSCGSDNESTFTQAIGAQFFAMSMPRAPLLALTAFYRRQIFDALEMKATYTIDTFSAKNIGLGLSTTLGKVNFYLLADNLLAYSDISKARSLSFQMGLNLIFAKKNTSE